MKVNFIHLYCIKEIIKRYKNNQAKKKEEGKQPLGMQRKLRHIEHDDDEKLSQNLY